MFDSNVRDQPRTVKNDVNKYDLIEDAAQR